jgi:ureidoacrylate peracid hydrolase
VTPLSGEVIVRKHRYSGFINTDLDLILRSRGVRSLIMTGVATSVCVDSTARDGFMRDYHVVYVEDCMSNALPTDELHRATLDIARRFFGLVVTSQEIMAIWRKSPRCRARA